MKDSNEYKLISDYYGNKCADRSQVPLINHIDEGLIILNEINSSIASKRAFCLHPLIQTDEAFKENYKTIANKTDSYTIMLAVEYRNIANSYLSDKINTEQPLTLSPLCEVNQMLIADKVQNYKDFMTYHFGTHPRSHELLKYFDKWLDKLNITPDIYLKLCNKVDDERKN